MNKTRDELMEEKMIDWTTFYRRNVHRFIQHYLGVKLHLFQIILMYFMNLNTLFMFIGSRGID